MFDNTLFNVMFAVVPVIAILIIVFVFAMMLSPKLRGKMMSSQIRATKYMIDATKDDLTDLGTTMANVGINTKKNILDQNEDVLRDIATREGNILKDKIRVMAKAVKDGLGDNGELFEDIYTKQSCSHKGSKTKDDVLSDISIYCSNCGKSIDADSSFCKNCGEEQ